MTQEMAHECCDTEVPGIDEYASVAALSFPKPAKLPVIETTFSAIYRTFNAETGKYVSKLFHAALCGEAICDGTEFSEKKLLSRA